MKKKIDLEMIQIRKYPVQNITYMQKGGKKNQTHQNAKEKQQKHSLGTKMQHGQSQKQIFGTLNKNKNEDSKSPPQ